MIRLILRLPTAEFLLSGGQSMSWLLGNKLITVTTSGCAQKALKHGLCDKCWLVCQRTPDTESRFPLNRSASNENKDDSSVASGRATRQNSIEQKSNNDTSPTSPVDRLDQLPSKLHSLKSGPERQLCSCWCQGWAEIHVRRPTGDMSWVMRIQNQIAQDNEFPLNEISSLFMPSLSKESLKEEPVMTPIELDVSAVKIPRPISVPVYVSINTSVPSIPVPVIETTSSAVSGPISIPDSRGPSRQSSRESDDCEPFLYYEDGTRARNPVRRSNSSPEMSASWKNPFMAQAAAADSGKGEDGGPTEPDGQKKSKKDMRVSCEAIPEEISGLGKYMIILLLCMYVIIHCYNYNLCSFIRYHLFMYLEMCLVDVYLAMILNTTILLINSTWL